MVVAVQDIMVITHGGMGLVGQEIILPVEDTKMGHIGQVQVVIIIITAQHFYHLQIHNMKLEIKKINEEKVKIIITENNEELLNEEIFFIYMEDIVFTKQNSLDKIQQLIELYGEFTTIENDFNI
jgi:hypothetical protein